MQMTYNEAVRFGRPMAFSLRRSRDYMMRSEKRGENGGSYRSSGGRKPPRRRRKAGFFYILFTILLSLIFWPVGMIMLWRRKVRWNGGVKLVFSLISLFLCIFLIVFALTMPTDNEKITNAQDTINDYLDTATTAIAAGYDIAYEACGKALVEMSDFAEAFAAWSTDYIADGLDMAVEYTGEAKDFVVAKYYELTGKEAPAADDEADSEANVPDVTDEPEVTDEPAATDEPEAIKAPAVTVTADENSATADASEAAAEPTEAPVEAPTDNIAVTLPESTPDPVSAQPLESGTLTDEGLEPGVTPEAAAAEPTPVAETPTPVPTEEPAKENPIPVKDPAEAVVYYNASGVSYHIASSCKGMSTAVQHTLAEAIADGKRPCTNCTVPEASILEAENVIWTDEAGYIHTKDDCEAFTGKYVLMTLSDAYAAGFELCGGCPADVYASHSGVVRPTATPGPETILPGTDLKPVGEVTVYHSSNGSYYHRFEVCKGMSGSNPYTLQDSVDDNFKRCRTCNAPDPELIDAHCLWVDKNGACHTSDECSLFSGDYDFILRDDALAQGMTGCIECGADEYLQPNTIIAY